VTSRQRWITGFLGLVVVLTISAGVLWSARSGLLRWLIVRQLSALTQRQASIDRLDLEIWRGRVEIAGLRLADRQPGPPFAELERVDVQFSPRALLRATLAIGEIAIRGVRVRVVRSEQGELNVPDLVLSGKGVLDVTIDRLTLADGHVSVEDRARTPVRDWRVDDIAVQVSGLSTPGPNPGSGRLTASLAGSPISAEVSDLRLTPLHLRGGLALKDVDAALAGIFLPNVVTVVEGARFTANASVQVDAREGMRLDADGHLDALTIRNRRTGEAIASVPSLAFTVAGVHTDASGGVPKLGRITVTGDGTLFDARGTAAGRLAIQRLQLLIEETGTSAPSSARVAMTAAFGSGGDLDVQGPLRLAPFGAELRGRITDLDASVLLSYVDLPVRLAGALDTDLTVDLASSAGGTTSRIRGRAAVKRVAVGDRAREIARARSVEVEGVDAQWPRVAVQRIRVVEPAALVERNQEGQLTLAALFASPRPAPGKGAASQPPPSATVEVGEISLVDGTVSFDDALASAPARLTLSKLQVSAKNAAWPARRPVPIEIRAVTPEAGTLEANGTVSLDPAKLDVRARLAGAALAPYQGYIPFAMRVQGLVELDLAIAAAFGATMTVTAKGTGALNNLTMGDGDHRILWVSRIETTGLDYAFPAKLAVDKLRVGRSRMRIERRADGTYPLPSLFERPKTSPEKAEPTRSAPGTRPAPPISVTVRDALLEDGGVRWIDAAVNPSANIEVSDVRLAARDFTWPPRAPIPVEVRAATPGGGRVGLNGALDLAGRALDGKVTVGSVDLAPLRPYLPPRATLAAKVNADLDVKARQDPRSVTARGSASVADVAFTHNDRPAIGLVRAEVTGVDYTWPSTVAIDRLRIQTPRASIYRNRDGTFPLVTFFTGLRQTSGARSEAPSSAAAPPSPLQVSVRESVLEDGAMTFADGLVNPTARIELAGIRLGARDFVWPLRGPLPVTLRASMPGEGTVKAQGNVGLTPTTVELEVTAEGVDLAVIRPYVPVRGQVRGKAGVNLKVNATTEPFAMTARGTATVTDAGVFDQEKPLLTAERIELTALDYAWPATVKVDRLRVQKPWALVDRIAGQLPVLQALTSPAPPAPPRTPDTRRRESRNREGARRERPAPPAPDASAPRVPVQIELRRSVFENGGATIVDSSADPPVRVEITDARLFLRDLAWPSSTPAGFTVRAATPNGGRIEARGQLRLDTPTIDVKLVVQNADLAALQPLYPLKGRIAGKANADLQIKGPVNPMALVITGTLAAADASFGDAERPLVTTKGVELAGIAAEWPRRRARIQRVSVREPWALVERDADGTLPMLALLALKPTNGAPAQTAAAVQPSKSVPATTDKNAGASGIELEVATLVVEEGFVRFTDRTTTPRFVEEASQLALTASKLGTAPTTRSEIALSARLTGGAQVELQGTTGAIGGPIFADLQGKLSGLALNRTNPYLNKLLGWVAREGSIVCTTHFQIQNDKLVAENEIVVGQPLFVPSRRGDEVRERVGVPLDLLVSLLENTRREVRLSVPVTGVLSSRQFDFGDAVWEAIRKAAINVLALPVSWVGKMFYTKEARIDTISIWPVHFEPGTTTMRRGFDKHAERLGTFLRQTPAIAFEMKPVMTVEDVDALKLQALKKQIDALVRDVGTADAAAARLFAERFPNRTAPTDPAALMAELVKAQPSSDSALQTLAKARIDLVRQELESKGDVNPKRLRVSEGAVPIEASGAGRVEFEMIPDAARTQSS